MKRILVVDDQPLLLQSMGKALKSETTEVIQVETGAEALAEIASAHCHLCFLDVFLPDMDGTEVLKAIRAVSPATTVVMMTAGVMDDAMKETIAENADLFIGKPFDLFQIRMIARRVIDGPGG